MTKARAFRPSFNFSRGVNTDASPVTFPPNSTVDEENFDLLIDGARRVRLGLENDSDEVTDIVPVDTDLIRTFKWSNAGGDPDSNFVVTQIGNMLKFYLDESEVGSTEQAFSIDLLSYKVEGTDDTLVRTNPIAVAFGRGHLFVVGKYLEPFYVTYTIATNAIAVFPIDINERDFEGVPDGADNVTTPNTLTDQYLYNLLNSGWKQVDIDQYHTDKSVYPAKNMLAYLGYRRSTVTGFDPADGTLEFSSDKMEAELFQDAPAPKGHFIRNIFDTANLPVPASVGVYHTVTDFHIATPNPGPNVFRLEIVGHGLLAGTFVEFYTGAGTAYIQYETVTSYVATKALTGSHEITNVPDSDHIEININLPSDFLSLVEYPTSATLHTDDNLVDNSAGYVADVRPVAVAFFAGRVWYAGVNYDKIDSKIFFSQVIESPEQYGKCYQVADPTDWHISDLIETDGGTINIPEMAQVYNIVPYSSSLLVFAANGVWQIGPGAGGYFTATSYSIRRISPNGVDGPGSVVITDTNPYYWGKSSIFTIVEDPNQGFLVVQNLSDGVVANLFNSIPLASKANVIGVFDSLVKRIMWLYRDDEDLLVSRYNVLLIFDLKYNAFIKWRLASTTSVAGSLFCIKNVTAQTPERNIKIVSVNAGDVSIAQFSDATFEDFGTPYTAYMLTGYDVSQSPHMYKYAPIVHVFVKKTETGFDEDSEPVRPGSLTMQARWDWADHTHAGKWGTAQECYRRRRMYVPGISDNFDDGVPVVVTRNKVRGRGRSLHLKFETTAGHDAYLLGWATNFDVLTDN